MGLIGEVELQVMKCLVLLINIVCGGIVDEVVLIWVLKVGWIGGVGFDVLIVELFFDDYLLFDLVLLVQFNFLLMLYVVWFSWLVMQVLVDQLIVNIEVFVVGVLQNWVV